MSIPGRPDRRTVLGCAMLAPVLAPVSARAAPLPSFTQGRHSFVFLTPARMAPDVTLPMTDGRTFKVRDQRTGEAGARRATILYFGATWCPPCRAELSAIEARIEQPVPPGSGPRPRVMAIMMDGGGARVVTPFLRGHGLRRAVALDPQQVLGRTSAVAKPGDPFVLWALPLSYVLAPDGRIVGYLPGAIDWTQPDAAALLRQIAQMG